MLYWFLPTLLWQGDPLPDGSDDALEGEANVDEEESLVEKALRANFCPNCVLNIILVDSLIVSQLCDHTKYRVTHQDGKNLLLT